MPFTQPAQIKRLLCGRRSWPFTAQPLRGFHAEEGSLCRAPGGWGGAWRTRELGSGPGFWEHTGGSNSKRETGHRHPSETFGAESSLPVAQACLSLCAPWTVARQAPLSMDFSRQEYWRGWPFPVQGTFPTQELNPGVPHCRQILYCLNHLRKDTFRNAESPREKFFSLPVADAG